MSMSNAASNEPKSYVPFTSWLEVVHYCQTNPYVGYKAPLDFYTVPVLVRMVFKNGKVKVQSGSQKYTFDHTHLDRFRKLA